MVELLLFIPCKLKTNWLWINKKKQTWAISQNTNCFLTTSEIVLQWMTFQWQRDKTIYEWAFPDSDFLWVSSSILKQKPERLVCLFIAFYKLLNNNEKINITFDITEAKRVYKKIEYNSFTKMSSSALEIKCNYPSWWLILPYFINIIIKVTFYTVFLLHKICIN